MRDQQPHPKSESNDSAKRELGEVKSALSAMDIHPELSPQRPEGMSLRWLGRLLASLRSLVRGVGFQAGATLLAAHARPLWMERYALDMQWYCPRAASGSEVQVCVRNQDASVEFEDRWLLSHYQPDSLGFIYPRRVIALPEGAAAAPNSVVISVRTTSATPVPVTWCRGFPAVAGDHSVVACQTAPAGQGTGSCE